VKRKHASFPLAVVVLALTSTAMASTTWYVNGATGNNSNNCKSPAAACKTIGHAISLAASGDSIMVAAGTYTENLTINKSLKIIGSGASATVIDGRSVNTVVTISSTGANVVLSNLTIRNGENSSGGGVNNSGRLTLNNSTVTENLAPLQCYGFNCLFHGGTASGGGIYNSGTLTISNSIISRNHAGSFCTGPLSCSAFGGGIYNGGTLMIQNSTLTGNGADIGCPFGGRSCKVGMGGAVGSGGGTVTLNNSTVEGNKARCSGGCSGTGGAIANGSGNLAMNNSTVSGNPDGGIFNGGTATLQNSIVANNSGQDCGGTITSDGYNLSSDSTCNLNGPGDMNNTNPNLGPLQNNGGPTQTMALPSGSPAIDAGNPSGCTDGSGHLLKTDQRGKPRPDKEDTGGCDMGAYERQSD